MQKAISQGTKPIFSLWCNWIFSVIILQQFFLDTKRNVLRMASLFCLLVQLYISNFCLESALKLRCHSHSLMSCSMGWNLLITSNQRISLKNPEYPKIYCHILWFCLKGCYNPKCVFVTSGRKTAITPKRGILHYVVASKFDLRLI